LGLPFYWYSAPNATAIITPTIFIQRGSRFETDFHYLTWRSLGRFYFSFLPYDKTFDGFKRTAGTAFVRSEYRTKLTLSNIQVEC
jgi:LPS-assembly protein